MEYREIGAQEEIEIIKKLMEGGRPELEKRLAEANSGSSRIVFNMGDHVIKFAVGESGYLQNRNEVAAYLSHQNAGVFARIGRVGRFIEEMEAVDPYDFRDGWDDYADADDFLDYLRNEEGIEDAEDVLDTISDAMHLLDDTTTDLAQVGTNMEGKWVCYDYGYQSGTSNQASGDTYLLFDDVNECWDYFTYCIKTLENAVSEDEVLSLVMQRLRELREQNKRRDWYEH